MDKRGVDLAARLLVRFQAAARHIHNSMDWSLEAGRELAHELDLSLEQLQRVLQQLEQLGIVTSRATAQPSFSLTDEGRRLCRDPDRLARLLAYARGVDESDP